MRRAGGSQQDRRHPGGGGRRRNRIFGFVRPGSSYWFPRDPGKFARDLSARLVELLEDEPKCKRFGEAGRQRVEEKFSWTKIAGETIRLYESLV